MKWRWLLFDYADPDLPLTMRKRMTVALRSPAVWRLPRSLRAGRWLFAVGNAIPLLILTTTVALDLAPSVPPRLGLLAIPIVVAVSWTWSCALYGLVCRREHYFRLRLAGFDVCLECGYWLRELPDDADRCPECGAEREPLPEVQQ